MIDDLPDSAVLVPSAASVREEIKFLSSFPAPPKSPSLPPPTYEVTSTTTTQNFDPLIFANAYSLVYIGASLSCLSLSQKFCASCPLCDTLLFVASFTDNAGSCCWLDILYLTPHNEHKRIHYRLSLIKDSKRFRTDTIHFCFAPQAA